MRAALTEYPIREPLNVRDLTRALMNPANDFLTPVSKANVVAIKAKDISAAEQVRLLCLFEQGTAIWFFGRLNVDVHRLIRAYHDLPRSDGVH